MNKTFRLLATRISHLAGSPPAFLVVLLVLLLSGWYYGFSEKWEIHTSFAAAIATFLMIFFLQHSQNVSDKATHLKLDELIRAVQGARNEVAAAEDKEEHEIDALKQTVLEESEDAKVLERKSR